MMKHRSSSRKTAPQTKPSEILGFHRALDIWYQLHGRHDLPWRAAPDAYRIWVSEVMLQQTQVATVRDRYYGQFLRQFPTVSALARAPLPKLLKAWEGMGYYRRAVNLHKAAQQTAPTLPSTFEELIALPGIGKNTAHAILAFAYRKPYPVLEANVKRVVARIFAETDEKKLWELAERLMGTPANHSGEPDGRSGRAKNRKRSGATCGFAHDHDTADGRQNGLLNPFDYNQAMMDVGSMICTPKAPKCKECPAMQICKGRKNPTAYPAAKIKKSVPTKKRFILVKQDAKGRLFLEARDSKLLGGMYGFPQHDAAPKGATKIGAVKHVYSHFKLEADVMLVKVATSNSDDWHSAEEIKKLPLSKVDLKVLALIS